MKELSDRRGFSSALNVGGVVAVVVVVARNPPAASFQLDAPPSDSLAQRVTDVTRVLQRVSSVTMFGRREDISAMS